MSNNDLMALLAEAVLEIKNLSSKVDRLSEEVTGSIVAEGWASPKEAAIALKPDGVRSVYHLRDLRLDGAFSEVKKEIRNVGKGDTKRWEYNIPKCRSALAVYFRRRSA